MPIVGLPKLSGAATLAGPRAWPADRLHRVGGRRTPGRPATPLNQPALGTRGVCADDSLAVSGSQQADGLGFRPSQVPPPTDRGRIRLTGAELAPRWARAAPEQAEEWVFAS